MKQLKISDTPNLNARLYQVVFLVGILVSCVGATVLIIRILEITLTNGSVPGYLHMKTPSSIGILLGGISLSCLATSRWPFFSQACAILMIGVSICNYLLTHSSYLDPFHFQFSSNLAHSPMSPLTALNLALLGGALALADQKKQLRLFQWLAFFAGATAWLGFSRFIIGGESLWVYGRMTIPTTLCFLVLTAGVFIIRADGGLLKLLANNAISGAIARQLLLFAAVVSFTINLIHLNTLGIESLHPQTNTNLVALLDVILFTSLIWLAVRLLRLGELRHQHLEQSGRQFAAIVESSDDAIISKNLDGIITSWNSGAEKIFGYTEAEAVGKPMLMLFPLENVAEEHEILKQIATGKMVKHFEAVRITKNGTAINVSVSISPIKDNQGKIIGASKIARDITQRKQVEQELSLTNEKFRQLTENIQEVFWLNDPVKSEMLYVSPAFEKIWGESCEKVYAQPDSWFKMVHLDDRERVIKAIAQRSSTGKYDEVYRIIRPDKQVRWIHDRAFPIRNAAGEIYRIAGTAEDITARRNIEDQLRQAQKLDGIGQLAGGVAHDFNNILAVIELQLEILKNGPDLSPEQIECADEIWTTVSRAAALTRQLLLFSRQEVFQPRDLNLNQTVVGISNMLRRTLGENINIKFKLAPEALFIHADASMIDQVLLNLMVNARDAMPDGGQIIIETMSVELDEFAANQFPQARTGAFARLSLSDNGSGIPPEILPKIFDPFFTSKPVGKGTGLGLATVFGIVRQHQGWIDVNSELGRGTIFHIYFPQQGSSPKAPETERITMRKGNEMILLVEDEPALRASVSTILTQLGHPVLEANSGVKALELWQQHRHEIRLLLTDLVMPDGITGKDLARQLLQMNPQIKVIYMSGYSTEVVGKDFPLQEGHNFLTKPFKALKLNQAIRSNFDEA